MVLGVPSVDRRDVALVDDQPLLAVVVAAAPAAGADDREAPADLLAVQDELDLARAQGLRRAGGLRLRLEIAPVPDDDVAGSVLHGGNDALEVELLDRGVLGA